MAALVLLIKIALLIVLGFVLLTYTIFLYEKTNRDGIQVKRLLGLANFGFCLKIVIIEYLSLLVTIVLWPFGFLNLNEGDSGSDQPPVLLLHGLFLNRSCWLMMKLRLRLNGITDVYTINLAPTRDIETATEKVALKVDSLRHARKCDKVHLVGHSMGGIIARNYIQIRGGAQKVDQCIALGSPHHGSKLAPFAVMKLSEAIMPGSDFLVNLNQQPIPDSVSLSNIYSRHDNLVIPFDNGVLDRERVDSIELKGKGHNTLLYDNTVFKHVLSRLNRVTDADNTGQKQQPG